MYDEKIEQLIKAALADGVLTEKEKQILFKRAQEQGIDLDEFEMVLDARLVELQKAEQEKREKSAPKSDKYGDVRKCPACGAIVGAFKGCCPECGYEFSNIDANLSSKKLHESLSKSGSSSKKVEIIETFPIPNTKADLLEFLTALKPRVLDVSSEFANAYFKKYSECIEKAKVSFPNDKLLLPFIDDFDNLKKQINNSHIKSKLQDVAKTYLLPLLCLLLLCAPVLIASKAQERKSKKCIELIDNGQTDKAKTLLSSIKYNKKTAKEFYVIAGKLVESYVSNGDVDKAYDVYKNLTPRKPKKYPYRSLSVWYRNDGGGYGSLIREAYIKQGAYDSAWRCLGELDDPHYAEEYYKFMSEVIYYLCRNGQKTEAKQFVAEYSRWFEKNVDTDSYYRNGEYAYSKAKARLMKIISNY